MKQKIFVINAGSSSLKFQLIEAKTETIICKGLFEQIGSPEIDFSIQFNNQKVTKILPFSTHKEAVEFLLEFVKEMGIISSFNEIDGVGHRVAHGGEYTDSVLINEETLSRIEELSHLAPLHNPVNVVGIRAFQKELPNVKQVAVFDTSFHHTLLPEYYMYPITYRYYEELGIRKYGFHGTSHQYIYDTVHHLLKAEGKSKRVISCHLGNGSSICAIKDGKSLNTSMGFTPLAGLMMGTRSGDIDPSIVTYIEKEEGLQPEEMDQVLTKESGLLGISGISNDVRTLQKEYQKGNKRAKLALDMFVNRVAQTIATYIVDLGGLDCLVFTAGIGENSEWVRSKVCEKLKVFNIELDEEKNTTNETFIQSGSSKSKIAVISTNEEVMIARDVVRIN